VSLNDRLATYFTAYPGEWVDGRELAKIAGSYAWRTRVSNLRQRGMPIENRVRRVTLSNGQTIRISEYRLVVRTIGQQSLY
jgi:hypothetical protein